MSAHESTAPHKGLHPVSLSFNDRHLEKSYRHYLAAGPRFHMRLALALGLAFYASLGLLDTFFVPADGRDAAWLMRSAAMLFGMSALLLTYHRLFRHVDQVAIALTGIAAAAGLTGVMRLMPVDAMAQYYVAIVIVVFWTCLFPGLRFLHGLWATLAILVLFFQMIGSIGEAPDALLASSAFFLITASLMAGAESYMRERRRRLLFEQANRSPGVSHGDGGRSLYDRLTGLANRDLLADRLDHALVLSRRDTRRCAGFYLALADFARVTEAHGRGAADDMLQVVAQRLSQTMRESDTVARLGDSEFFILARGIDSEEAATSVASRVRACVERPIPLISGQSAQLSARLGICPFPYPDCTADDIVYRAERALRAVGEDDSRGFAFFVAEDGKPPRAG